MRLFENVAVRLGLYRQEGDAYLGIHEGYPVAVSTFGDPNGGQWGFLFHVRHPRASGELPDRQQYHWNGELEKELKQDLAKVEIEEKIAWLTIYDVDPRTPCDSIVHLLEAFLAGLHDAGVVSVGQTCHYCLQKPGKLSFLQGRVLQVCEDCLGKHLQERALQRKATGVGIVRAWARGVAAAVLGAMLWAGFWFTFDWLVLWLGSSGKKVIMFVPGLSEVLIALCIGGLVGFPVGYVLRRIPNRGTHAAKVSLCCVLAGTLLGEALFVTLWAYYLDRVWFFSLQSLWAFWMGAGIPYLVKKIVAAGLGLAIAYDMARVKIRPI